MKRVALYARYSSDKQKPVSIVDQVSDCRAYAARQGWTVVGKPFTDPKLSGRTMRTRPGLQALISGAVSGQYDAVLAIDLDRFSRDLADPAIFFKKMRFARVDIITIADGVVGPMQIGFKGTMNAMERDKIAVHTRRGQRGRIAKGRSAGGCAYGYRKIPGPLVEDPKTGELVHERGLRQVHPEEAEVVRRIYRDYVAGISPKQIAISLNREGLPGPGARYNYKDRGPTPWSPSTIHGHVARGTGILNNELYIGRRVWNRHQFDFDPDTEKRVARLNDQSEWVVKDEPDLRIIDDELWAAAKARQERTRQRIAAAARSDRKGSGLGAVVRPVYVFSGLTKCGVCGGSYSVWHRTTLKCFNRMRGACSNTRTIRVDELEHRVNTALETKFFQGGAFDAFCEGFVAELNRLRREDRARRAEAPRELARINRRSNDIKELLLSGFRDEAWKVELRQIEQRRAELEATIAATGAEPPPPPALHPQMRMVFAQKVRQLADALQQTDHASREAARDALRGFVERIEIPADPSALLTVRGVMGTMLAAACGRNGSAEAVAQLVNLGESVGCGGGI